jgi:nitroreductase
VSGTAEGGRPADGGHWVSPVQQLIVDRRTVQDYRQGPLPGGALARALEVALSAPNHRMTEPWRFVQVGPQNRQLLFEIGADLKSAPGAPLAGGARDRLAAKMLVPTELVVICQAKAADPEVAQEDYAATACAVYAAMLSLWSEGVGSKWSTGDVTTDERTYAALDVDPAQQAIVGFLWVGLDARPDAPKPRRRRTLDQILRSVP